MEAEKLVQVLGNKSLHSQVLNLSDVLKKEDCPPVEKECSLDNFKMTDSPTNTEINCHSPIKKESDLVSGNQDDEIVHVSITNETTEQENIESEDLGFKKEIVEELTATYEKQTTDIKIEEPSYGGKFACNQCCKVYAHPNNLWRHKKEHDGVRYICGQCGRQFGQKSHLNIHVEGVHEKKRFQCEDCGDSLSRRALPEHKKAKHEGRRFICDQCDLVFTQKGNLHSHKKHKHGGVRYYCSQCGLNFGHPTTLTLHIKVQHDGEKFVCDVCEKTFNSKRALKFHGDAKHENISYQCDICSHKSTQPGNLKAHKRKIHGN